MKFFIAAVLAVAASASPVIEGTVVKRAGCSTAETATSEKLGASIAHTDAFDPVPGICVMGCDTGNAYCSANMGGQYYNILCSNRVVCPTTNSNCTIDLNTNTITC